MRRPAFLLASLLALGACAPPDDASAPSAADEPARVEPVADRAAGDPAPPAGTPEAPDDPASGDPLLSDEAEIRAEVARLLAEGVSDGPPAPDMEAWDDGVNVVEMAGYYAGTPASAADVEAFEDYCGGIASAIAPGEGGVVRAYLRRGIAGGWTVIDSEVCYSDGSWQTWEEAYTLPEGLVVEVVE